MVQSSLIVPDNSSASTSQKRPTDDLETSNVPTEEIKRPRLDNSEAGQRRNKRLFGNLLGTLNKFRDDTEKNSQVDKNRQKINEKLHEKLEQERRELAEKLKARKEEKSRLTELKLQEEQRVLREKEELTRIHLNEKLANFLKTSNTEPVLYYLPAKLTDEMVETIHKQKQEALEARMKFENNRRLDSREEKCDTDENVEQEHNSKKLKQEDERPKVASESEGTVTEERVQNEAVSEKDEADIKSYSKKDETSLENIQAGKEAVPEKEEEAASEREEGSKVGLDRDESSSNKNGTEKEDVSEITEE